MDLKLLKWRSVHDALPGIYGNVILCYRTNVGDEGWNVAEGYRNKEHDR